MQKIDVRSILSEKSPRLGKRLPGFLFRYLEKTIRQEEVNEVLYRFGHLSDIEFVGAILDHMGISWRSHGTENIPDSGRFLFVSNHPLGGLDGLVFMKEVSNYFSDIKFPVNDLLLNLKNMSGIFLPVNKHGAQARSSAAAIEEAYASDSQMLYFPAGLCSRRRRGKVCDLPWQKNFVTKAIAHKRDIIPVYISGENSPFFYRLSNLRRALMLKVNIEMLYLVDEMFRQKGKSISITFGEPIKWESLDSSKKAAEWAKYIRAKCYELEQKAL